MQIIQPVQHSYFIKLHTFTAFMSVTLASFARCILLLVIALTLRTINTHTKKQDKFMSCEAVNKNGFGVFWPLG